MLNAEGHDESQYLPKGLPAVNAYRAQHGKVIWEGDSIKSLEWLPDAFFGGNEKEEGYLRTCNAFFCYLVQFKRTCGTCDIRGRLFDELATGISFELDMFKQIRDRLPKNELATLVWFVWNDYNRGNMNLASYLLGTIKHALEHTKNIIDDCKKIVETASQTSPQLRLENGETN
jgi:hypothetical protein